MTLNPFDIDRIALELKTGRRQLSEDDALTVASALDDLLRGKRPEVGPGERMPGHVFALRRRDNLIRERVPALFGVGDLRWQAGCFHRALRRYYTTAWRVDRALRTCPPRYAGTERELCFHVLSTCERLLSIRQIERILST